MIEIYTDGSCEPNPGKGGWAWVQWVNGEPAQSDYGTIPETTNNRMEMLAVLKALTRFAGVTQKLVIYSDSQYVVNGMNDWVFRWQQRGWTRRRSRSVGNLDLWQEMQRARENLKVVFTWVRGHDGTPGNEYADALAKRACRNLPDLSPNTEQPSPNSSPR